jgi:hypothetical protein
MTIANQKSAFERKIEATIARNRQGEHLRHGNRHTGTSVEEDFRGWRYDEENRDYRTDLATYDVINHGTLVVDEPGTPNARLISVPGGGLGFAIQFHGDCLAAKGRIRTTSGFAEMSFRRGITRQVGESLFFGTDEFEFEGPVAEDPTFNLILVYAFDAPGLILKPFTINRVTR